MKFSFFSALIKRGAIKKPTCFEMVLSLKMIPFVRTLWLGVNWLPAESKLSDQTPSFDGWSS